MVYPRNPYGRMFGQAGAVMRRDPLNAQAYRTQRAGSPEDLFQPVYDRVNMVNAGANTLAFFSIPKGGAATLITGVAAAAARTKDYRDTNMDGAGVMPNKMIIIQGISIAFFHQTPGNTATYAADRERIKNNSYLKFKVIDKDILYLPLIYIPEANPLGFAATTANNTSILGSSGMGQPMLSFPIPITVNPNENITVEIIFQTVVALATAVETIDIGVILWSLIRRPG